MALPPYMPIDACAIAQAKSFLPGSRRTARLLSVKLASPSPT